jgi:hypothetical protein
MVLSELVLYQPDIDVDAVSAVSAPLPSRPRW